MQQQGTLRPVRHAIRRFDDSLQRYGAASMAVDQIARLDDFLLDRNKIKESNWRVYTMITTSNTERKREEVSLLDQILSAVKTSAKMAALEKHQ